MKSVLNKASYLVGDVVLATVDVRLADGGPIISSLLEMTYEVNFEAT
jgi:hypothetical protein